MYLEIDPTLTDSHEAIRTATREFAREVIRPAARKLDKLPAESVPEHPAYRAVMKHAYELGYHGALLPDTVGGMGLDPASIHIALEELGWGSGALAVSIGVSCFPALGATMLAPEDEELTRDFVLPYTGDRTGTIIGCWGITEPDHGSDWMLSIDQDLGPRVSPTLTARRDGDAWVLSGQKSAWVSNGPVATHCYLFVGIDAAKGMRGNGIALVDLRSKGVSRGKPWDKLGQRALPQGEIYFDEVRIPLRQMIVADPETYSFAVGATLALANSAMGAIFTGVARAAYEEALRYTRERIQGGAPLARHQAVQLKLSQMWQRVEVARAVSRRAIAHNYATTTPSLPHAVASKVFCTEAAFQNATDAVQLAGAMGVSKEFDIELIFRDARLSTIEDGVNDTLSLALGGRLVSEQE